MRTKNLPKSVLHDQSFLIVLKQVIKSASFLNFFPRRHRRGCSSSLAGL